MREDGGFEEIKRAILNLSLRHDLHISAYGEGNERRLTGKHETASIGTFSWVWMEHLSLFSFRESTECCLSVSCTNETFPFTRVWQTAAALSVWGGIPRQKGKVHVLAVFPKIAYSWKNSDNPSLVQGVSNFLLCIL
jgi:hypothetical protein